MPASSRRALRSISSKRVASPRPARGTRRLDLAARLKARARALRGRVERREAFIEAVREANASQDPRKVAEWMIRQAQSWVPAPCWVVIAHDVNGHLNVLADAGLVPNLGPSLWSTANWVMRHNAEFFSGDLAKDSRGGPGAAGSAIALPLTCRNRSVGALVVSRSAAVATTPSMGPSLVVVAASAPRAIGDRARQRSGAAARGSAVGHRRAHATVELALSSIRCCAARPSARAQRQSALAALSRSRQLQAGQRPARPPRRQQGADGSRGRHPRVRSRDGRRRAVRRRRVHAAAAGHEHGRRRVRLPNASAIGCARHDFWHRMACLYVRLSRSVSPRSTQTSPVPPTN